MGDDAPHGPRVRGAAGNCRGRLPARGGIRPARPGPRTSTADRPPRVGVRGRRPPIGWRPWCVDGAGSGGTLWEDLACAWSASDRRGRARHAGEGGALIRAAAVSGAGPAATIGRSSRTAPSTRCSSLGSAVCVFYCFPGATVFPRLYVFATVGSRDFRCAAATYLPAAPSPSGTTIPQRTTNSSAVMLKFCYMY